MIIGNALAGAWALGANWLPQMRTRALWWFVAVAELTVFVQVTLGVILVNKYKFQFPKFHAFYGFVALATIGIIYSYRHQLRKHLYVLYGLGGLFLMGLALRAIAISPVPTP